MPLFTSLLNIIFSYDPVGYGLPYNYLMFTDSRETLVEIACQLLCVVLETNISINKDTNSEDQVEEKNFEGSNRSNLFISYISRIHRDEVSYSLRILDLFIKIKKLHFCLYFARILDLFLKDFVDYLTIQWFKHFYLDLVKR